MAYRYLDLASTPSVKAAQAANGSADMWADTEGRRESSRLTEAEVQFIAARDSFYMATVSEDGWPYMQHRGGPPGFLRVLDDRALAFADFRGNRFLMDYPHRRRLKIFARIEAKDLSADPELAARLMTPGYKARPERALLVHVEAFDWNCPQHITPRFSEAELESVLEPVRLRIERLEAENAALRAAQGA
jgi:predicted pyridoxine 5'-phosphate oxidase superfamily flavin-nucleotide-binding protein